MSYQARRFAEGQPVVLDEHIFQQVLQDVKAMEKTDYARVAHEVSVASSMGKYRMIEGSELWLKQLRSGRLLLQLAFPIAVVLFVLAWKLSWWLLLGLLIPFLVHGRGNYNASEANVMLAAQSLTLNRMLESYSEHWNASEENAP